MINGDMIQPVTGWELEGVIRAAIDDRARVAIAGGGTKSGIGSAQVADVKLSLSSLRGIEVDTESGIAVAQAGTPLRQVERELLRQNAMLSFEPPDFGPLFGLDPWSGTVGGAFAANLSGARAVVAGLPQSDLLGCAVINGHGETQRLGWAHGVGRARSDLASAMAGSWGMFGIITELAFRIVPLPDETASLVVHGLTAELATEAMTAAAAASRYVTGAAHLDRGIVPRLWSDRLSDAKDALTVVRCETRHGDAATRLQPIRDVLQVFGDIDLLPDAESTEFWSELQALSVFQNSAAPLWRLSVPPEK
ncbi:MAG: FAD-binding protein, partial [Pseudomonadota bacterium]